MCRTGVHAIAAGSSGELARGEPFGDYLLLQHLATGGMGELFLACRRGAERGGWLASSDVVVIKRVLPRLAPDSHLLAMFRDEAVLAAQLVHQNVCRVHRIGVAERGSYMVLEYLHGLALSQMLSAMTRRRQRFDERFAAGVIQQACAGLQYTHEASGADGAPLDIVHRDVSPPNIMVTTDGVVKLLDFGIAKAAGTRVRTRTGTLKGKNAYMSPEQVVGEAIDRRSDVFALGIVLYELLTARRLFQRNNEFMTFKAITEDPIPSLRLFRPDLRPLDDVIEQALERDPARRFQSTAEMSVALELALRRRGGPATREELAWSLERDFAVEVAGRDELLARARRTAALASAARGERRVRATLDERPGMKEADGDDPLGFESMSTAVEPEYDAEPLLIAPSGRAAPSRPAATAPPIPSPTPTLTPAWFVISEPGDMWTGGEPAAARGPIRRWGRGTLGFLAGLAIAAMIAGGVGLVARVHPSPGARSVGVQDVGERVDAADVTPPRTSDATIAERAAVNTAPARLPSTDAPARSAPVTPRARRSRRPPKLAPVAVPAPGDASAEASSDDPVVDHQIAAMPADMNAPAEPLADDDADAVADVATPTSLDASPPAAPAPPAPPADAPPDAPPPPSIAPTDTSVAPGDTSGTPPEPPDASGPATASPVAPPDASAAAPPVAPPDPPPAASADTPPVARPDAPVTPPVTSPDGAT